MTTYNLTRKSAKPMTTNCYVKFVACINSYPGHRRKDIMRLMGRKARSRGQLSDMWHAIISAGFVRFDEDFRYYITPVGQNLLASAAQNTLKC